MNIDSLDITQKLKMLSKVSSMEPIGGGSTTDSNSVGTQQVSFGEFLSKQFSEVNAQGVEAEKSIQRNLLGEEVNPHNTMLAVQKANISLTLMMSIKERLERAYQELIRMQIG